jgi:hypothetical protein
MSLPELPLHLQLTQMVSGYWLSQAIYAAAKLSLAEHLSKGAKSCQDLASLTETNPAALYRLMRALASVGIFQETESQQFILTPLAEHLSSDHPRSVKATAIMLGEAPHYQAWGNVLHSIKTGQPSFDDVFGMGVFEYFQTHPLDAEIFEQSMNSFSLSEEKAILAVYDFSEF